MRKKTYSPNKLLPFINIYTLIYNTTNKMIDYIVNWDWDPRFIKASKIAI